MTKEYTVTWTIEVEAYSPEHAAELAQKIQWDINSTANQFYVGIADEQFDVDLDSEEYLKAKIAQLDEDILCLECSDDYLMTNRNGNLPRYEAMKILRAELATKLRTTQ